MQIPVLEFHSGVAVVRDDLIPGGTKSRYLLKMMRSADAEEFVYATPAEGGAQVALALCAYQTGKAVTLFVPQRRVRSFYTNRASGYGAKIIEVKPGYLSTLQSRARLYADQPGRHLFSFGLRSADAIESIAETARLVDYTPDEVFCARGSGLLAAGLTLAFPSATIRPVWVGAGAAQAPLAYDRPFSKPSRTSPPFPSHPHYDAKAWEICQTHRRGRRTLFWNVAA